VEALALTIVHRLKQEPATRNSPVTRTTNKAYFPGLDGLRALAFFMVFGDHYLALPWGWAGVDVFFVLSGFLITGILFDTRDNPYRLRNFYIRRTLRIFPLYYGVILAMVLLYPVFQWRWSWHWLIWPTYIANFACVYAPYSTRWTLGVLAYGSLWSLKYFNCRLLFGHFWSLCVEEQFYLVWPWVVFWLRDRKKLLWVCAAFVMLVPILRVLASHTLPQFMLKQDALYRCTPFRIDALLLGGLIALVRRGSSSRGLLIAARVCFSGMLSVLVLWLILNPSARHGTIYYVYPPWHFTWGLSFIDIFAACVMVMAMNPGSITYRLFSFRPLRWLGKISYGAYVFHDIPHLLLMHLVQTHTGHFRLPTAALAFSVTLLAAWASFRWFESPMSRLKDRLTR
jgi:peptidoglycan/LPS O-acetylase OafA/YrhL